MGHLSDDSFSRILCTFKQRALTNECLLGEKNEVLIERHQTEIHAKSFKLVTSLTFQGS